MKFFLHFVLFGIILLSFTNCSTHKPLYYYGDYSEEYYTAKRELTPEAKLQLQHSIEEAINNPNNSISQRVAPGMYANLGYIYLKNANNAKAIEYFEKEKQLYPESAYFMQRMINKVKALEEKENE